MESQLGQLQGLQRLRRNHPRALAAPQFDLSGSARRSASREREGEDTDEEIEELLRARRRLEEPEEPVELKVGQDGSKNVVLF